MKVVLLKDVAQVGRQYEIKEVANGFARHFLLPRGLVLLADKTTLTRLEKWQKEAEAKRQREEAELNSKLRALAGATVILEVKAAANGHLFAGIHQAEIVEAVAAQTGARLASKLIQLDKPIKELGEHEIKLKSGDWEGSFKLIIGAAG